MNPEEILHKPWKIPVNMYVVEYLWGVEHVLRGNEHVFHFFALQGTCSPKYG